MKSGKGEWLPRIEKQNAYNDFKRAYSSIKTRSQLTLLDTHSKANTIQTRDAPIPNIDITSLAMNPTRMLLYRRKQQVHKGVKDKSIKRKKQQEREKKDSVQKMKINEILDNDCTKVAQLLKYNKAKHSFSESNKKSNTNVTTQRTSIDYKSMVSIIRSKIVSKCHKEIVEQLLILNRKNELKSKVKFDTDFFIRLSQNIVHNSILRQDNISPKYYSYNTIEKFLLI